jgi:hypothetical protein
VAAQRCRLAHVGEHAAQDALGVVALAEEGPVEREKPRPALRVREESGAGERGVEPPAREEHLRESLVGVQDEVGDEGEAEERREGQEGALRHRVLESLAEEHPDVEHAVAEDRVGKGQRARGLQEQAEQPEGRQPVRGEQPKLPRAGGTAAKDASAAEEEMEAGHDERERHPRDEDAVLRRSPGLEAAVVPAQQNGHASTRAGEQQMTADGVGTRSRHVLRVRPIHQLRRTPRHPSDKAAKSRAAPGPGPRRSGRGKLARNIVVATSAMVGAPTIAATGIAARGAGSRAITPGRPGAKRSMNPWLSRGVPAACMSAARRAVASPGRRPAMSQASPMPRAQMGTLATRTRPSGSSR